MAYSFADLGSANVCLKEFDSAFFCEAVRYIKSDRTLHLTLRLSQCTLTRPQQIAIDYVIIFMTSGLPLRDYSG